MSLFVCPICGAALEREPGRYRCPAGHSYDVAREGYTHLLPANRKHSKMPGDDKGMAAARSVFLSKDYYAALRGCPVPSALDYAPEHPAVLDTGCGEGHYTSAVYRALRTPGRPPAWRGRTSPRPSSGRAAKREKDVEFAVASSYHLPVADRSIDLLLNCFSPLALEEFRRALRPGGTFLYVVPSEKHLWELKQVLYDHPYPNEVKETPYEGFAYAKFATWRTASGCWGRRISTPVPDDPLLLENSQVRLSASGGAGGAGGHHQLRYPCLSPEGVRLPKIFLPMGAAMQRPLFVKFSVFS